MVIVSRLLDGTEGAGKVGELFLDGGQSAAVLRGILR